MSLTKFLKAPIKLFKKDVITFVIIRRYDLGILEDKLRYVAVRPGASISVLRQKVWHLLDLPDFCDEVIVLKSSADVVIPLSDLRKGNDPQHPYILEVWLPGSRFKSSTTIYNKLLTIENGAVRSQHDNPPATDTIYEANHAENFDNVNPYKNCSETTMSNEVMDLHKLRVQDDKAMCNHMLADFKKSELSCRMSSLSLLGFNGKKSRDNFTNIFLKIQSDLSNLNIKLSSLENKIAV